ncbi:MAG: YhjD/YihY/BrkB family envelope integrity protein [Acidobacteriota bacterium]|nr:YhjD/YihY/BrkB family envelope integrity protein [Acidobacteriota bacterium]
MSSRAEPARLAGRELPELISLARAVLVGTLRRFLDARGFDLAASLAYSALLTLVPLVACVTLLTSAFFGESGTGLYRLLRFLPGAGRDFVTNLQAFSVKATSLSGTATLFFLVTSLRTFFQIESTVQALWGSTGTPRTPLRRLGMALSVMILGPIALGVLTSLLLESGAPLGDFRLLGSLMSFGLLVYLYRSLPGSFVRWAPAVVAALLVSASLTLLRVGFARSVALLASLNQTYGPLSAIVIFVVAIGMMTTLFLVGVSLAHAIQYRDEFRSHDVPLERTEEGGRLYVASRILLVLAGAWQNDRATRSPALLAEAVARPKDEVALLVGALRAGGLLVAQADGNLALSRDPEKISLYAVSRAIGESAPRAVPAGHDAAANVLHRVFAKANREERAVLQGTSLRDLLPGEGMEDTSYARGLLPQR